MTIKTFQLSTPKNSRQYISKDLELKQNPIWRKETNLTSQLRSSKQWQDICRIIKSKEPVCWICEYNATEEIHHILEAHNHIDLFFEISNLAPLCECCHKRIHAAYRRNISPLVLFPLNRRISYNLEII